MKLAGQKEGDMLVQVSPATFSVLMNLALSYDRLVKLIPKQSGGVERIKPDISPYIDELRSFRDEHKLL